MSKLTDAAIATLKSYFETGDQPTEAQFAAVFDAIQQGIEEHDHNLLADGDAAPITDLACGARVPQFYRRQGGSATDWNTEGETDYTPTTVRMQCGTNDLSVTANPTTWNLGSDEITFPVAFSQKPIVLCTFYGPYYAGESMHVASRLITTTKFDMELRVYKPASGITVTIFWLAIGPE